MATHWLNDYASLREQFYKLPGHNAISVVRFLASHCDDAETRQCILNTYDGFRQSITVLERLFGGPGPKSLSAVNFMTNCFTHTLAQLFVRILPELDYTSFVHLKSRGAHELLKEMLRCKNMDFDSLCGALVALNRTRYVHKLCLEVGLGPRMATIEAYGGRGLVRGMVTAQSSFARAERCVVWTVQRSIQLDRFCHRTFFSYADSVFRGCAGDEFLYKTCLGNVERVTPTPGALFDDSSRKLIALDITNTWPTIYFGAFFATRTSGARCFELDLKSLESLGPDEVLNMKNAKNLENVPIPRQLAAIVDPGAQTNNMGCCGSETAILNFDCTDGSCGPSVVLRNFCWQNALHISIGTVHIYFLCAGAVYDMNLAAGTCRRIFSVEDDFLFCQMLPGRIVLFNKTNSCYAVAQVPQLKGASHLQHLRPYMFFPGTSFPYVADYVGQARSFLEVGGFLLFLDQALFFGKVGKHLLFVSKKFIVRGIRTAVAP